MNTFRICATFLMLSLGGFFGWKMYNVVEHHVQTLVIDAR